REAPGARGQTRGRRRGRRARERGRRMTISEQEPPRERPDALRQLSAQARATVDRLTRVAELLEKETRLGDAVLTRPHPLLAMVRRGGFMLLLVPASVWDKGRQLLAPYADAIASVTARLAILGHPTDPDLG